MKNFIVSAMLSALFIFPAESTIFANDTLINDIFTETEYYDGYTVTTVTTIEEQPSFARTIHSKSATKTATIKNNSGTTVATCSISASFIYNGSSSSCTSVTHNTSIVNTSWAFTTATSSKSKNTATGNFTCKSTGLISNTIPTTITLTCSSNGTIS